MSVVTSVNVSEMSAQNRFSAEFFDPQYEFRAVDDSEWVPLGTVLKQVQYGLSLAMNDTGLGFPILRMNELDLGFVKSASRFADIDDAVSLRYLIEPGDVLFNRTNAFNMVGRTGIALSAQGTVFASYLIRLRPDPTRVLPEYLTAYLNTPFGISQVRRRAMRSINQANVSGSEIRKVKIPLLPMSVQGEVRDLLHKSHESISTSEKKHARAIEILNLQHPLISAIPGNISVVNFRMLLDDRRFDAEFFSPGSLSFAAGIADSVTSIGLTSAMLPLSVNIDPRKTPDLEYRYVELSNIDPRTGAIAAGQSRIGSDLPSRARRRVQSGDVVASSVLGSLNKVAYVDDAYDGAIVSTGFFHLRPYKWSGHFVLALMKSRWVKDQFQRYGNGGILSAVPDDALEKIKIPAFSDETIEEVSRLGEESQDAVNEGRALFRAAIELTQQSVCEKIKP
ncbi:hypothetical protein KPL76_01930 [Subtercola sp. PAMC28395]|uniref:restriction endonuclease subunit S n=1 Tax=Subtercola sp. PAMC28395 TaxID=2846775 RepID=UPI001C0DC4AC|nr:hypothetical protein [Subtercola sp. PAMC28395]QWT24211.1 hypothetical protein KPL76_01930 [Subtercola sp. PAMC28395]